MPEKLVIVGAGQAGGDLATTLRQRGWNGHITLVGDEPSPPYQRPPLSKGYLLGKVSREQLFLKPTTTYERFDIALRLGTRVQAVDRTAKDVVISDGSRLPYDKLVLATGRRARPLTLPGVDADRLDNLFTLRRIDDVDALRPQFVPGRRLVLVGGGYVGLEIAAVAAQLGLEVTVVEAAPRLLARVTGPEVSSFLEGVHRSHGVRFRLASTVARVALDASGRRVTGVDVSTSGVVERLVADLVLVGIGMQPNTALASAAGLEVDDGIVVDEFARTSDPDVLAIGDCANQPSAYAGRRVRLESAPNAIEHAKVAAATILGRLQASTATPWFWSEQYGLKLQMVGLSGGADQCITRGNRSATTLSAFYLKGDRIAAADVISRPADFAAARRLVTSGARVDPDRLADDEIPLAEVAI
ncbi:pyridine nucleotide-disulfide oxidoreductase [Saccharothrix sp. ALI-22-I]|uniref:NAD(P)/FAD-dependent oxidoreductase n=1 Tax=Saccharothrix sp. ALI-22-I TaxID=1933778 RepID=UPI00097BE70B|nr:FAD-dependent oxidoreductase [Saccharothrix sp. ALI-22-I]ONI93055.1 pyridine nucleotide-disulfide oxidoreductase [Saccharothrix sp. ALI-22-I]